MAHGAWKFEVNNNSKYKPYQVTSVSSLNRGKVQLPTFPRYRDDVKRFCDNYLRENVFRLELHGLATKHMVTINTRGGATQQAPNSTHRSALRKLSQQP